MTFQNWEAVIFYGRITAELKHYNKIMIHKSVLTLNLQKRLRILYIIFR